MIEGVREWKIVNVEGVKEIYGEVKREGKNVKEIGKKVNENGYVEYKEEVGKRMKEVREVWELLKEYVEKEG